MPIECDPDKIRTSHAFLDEEFIAEESLVTIVPEFTMHEPLRFISNEFGPFRKRSEVQVPLWVALYLERHGKCSIQSPDWLSLDAIRAKIEEERALGPSQFAQLPNEYMFQVALLLLNRQYLTDQSAYLGGPQNRHAIEVALQELQLIRRTKITEGLKRIDASPFTIVDVTNLSSVEREIIRKQTLGILEQISSLWQLRDVYAPRE